MVSYSSLFLSLSLLTISHPIVPLSFPTTHLLCVLWLAVVYKTNMIQPFTPRWVALEGPSRLTFVSLNSRCISINSSIYYEYATKTCLSESGGQLKTIQFENEDAQTFCTRLCGECPPFSFSSVVRLADVPDPRVTEVLTLSPSLRY